MDAVDLISRAIAHCRDQGVSRLLIDASGLEDLPIPSLVDRFLMVEDWAQAAQSTVVVALVAHAQYIHRENSASRWQPASDWCATSTRPKLQR